MAEPKPAVRMVSAALRWLPLMTKFLLLQASAQTLGFLTGLALVRILPVSGFGKYSILLAVQGTATALGDMGVSSAVSALGAKVCEDPKRFGEIISCALVFRRRLEVPALIVGGCILLYLLRRGGAPWGEALLVCVAFAFIIHAQIRYSLYSSVPLLCLRFEEVQYVAIVGAAFRFVSVWVLVFLTRSYLVAVMLVAVSQWIQAELMARRSERYIVRARPRDHDKAAILEILKGQLLAALYFAFEPQLSVFLISAFGNVQRTAEIGALGRLTIIIGALGAMVGALVTPRFARLVSARDISRRYLHVLAGTSSVAAGFYAMAHLFPSALLALIGPKYSHLQAELALVVGLAAWNFVVFSMASLNISRAWNEGSWLYVPGSILTQIALLHYVDLSTIRGVVFLSWGALLSPTIITFAIGFRGVRAENAREMRGAAQIRLAL